MSMPYVVTRTNYFRVTDEEAYGKLFEKLWAPDADVEDFSRVDQETGIMWHGFGAFDEINYVEDPEDTDHDWAFEEFLKKLQPLLPDGEAMIVRSVGHEKLCDIWGEAYVVTKNGLEYINLSDAAVGTARAMLGNKGFSPKMHY